MEPNQPETSEPAKPQKKKQVLVVAAQSESGEETFASFLAHCYADNIDVTVASSFEEGADLLFPKFDIEQAERHMAEIELPQGARFEISKTRFGHHVTVHDHDGQKMSLTGEHIAIGLAVQSVEARYRLAPFDTMITEETVPLKSVPKSPQTYLGLSLIALAQMAKVPRIGILIPKGGQEVKHFIGDIRCGETRLVLSFHQPDWKWVSRELIGL